MKFAKKFDENGWTKDCHSGEKQVDLMQFEQGDHVSSIF